MTQTAAAGGDLLFATEEAVGLVTFNRPQARNALTFEMYEGLATICREAGRENALRALIVTGAGGKSFAAGTDISLFRNFDGRKDGLAYEQKMEKVLHDIESCVVPTIAAISGACTGGGAAIAAACDVRLATRDIKFGVPIARTLGNCLSIGNLHRLSSALGASLAREILLTSRLIEAEEAERIGLASEFFDDAGAMMARARELARQMTAFAPLTIRATKKGFARLARGGADAKDDDLIALCYGSEDFREGLDAFLAKRKPEWKGR
ncbi:MAG: enoyl-CoA hydratase [Pseudomonadota bacterium]|nr:enoyl-CoA hydratase [Pseudomonadota bacterium]